MGAFGEIKDQFSLQDLGINTALGIVGGVITPRLFGVPSKGTLISGGILGTASYITDLVPEQHMTPMRSTLFTVFMLGLMVFGIKNACIKYPGNFLVKLLPTEIKPLICVAALNAFGKTMMIYFPVIFPGLKTAPTLPKALKDLFVLTTKEVRACHSYYEGNSEAFTDLPVKTQLALNHAFKSETLSTLSTTPLTPTSFDSWKTEELCLIRDQEISMGAVDIENAFETKCYASQLEPPKTISEAFPLPASTGAIAVLNPTQQKWYFAFFDSHPSKWDELNPAKQLAFLSFFEFVGLNVRAPKTTEEVNELDKDGVTFFHVGFDSKKHSPDVGLAFIKRFAAEGLTLPENIQEQLATLQPVTTPDAVNKLSSSELALYQLQFRQDPDRYWNPLDVTTRWAFRSKSGDWPSMSHPSSEREIQSLSPDLVAHFHRTFNSEQITEESLRLAWYEKFYECELLPQDAMARDCSRILRRGGKKSPFISFSNASQVDNLHEAKLTWFSQVYRHYREAWIALPLKYQAPFRARASETLTFPTFTCPVTVDAVTNLDKDATEALQAAFNMEIMHSKGRGLLSWGSSPLDDQNPKLFKLPDVERHLILVELGKKFTPPLPKGFDRYVEAPKTAGKIVELDTAKLQYWAKYFLSNIQKWEELPLIIQINYLQHAQTKHVAPNEFPPPCIRNSELKELVEKGNQAQASGTPNDGNLDYQAILCLAQTAQAFNLETWVRWPREIQLLLKTAFGHLAYDHTDARLGGAIPETPANAPLGVIAGDFVQAFHNNFHPTAFKGVNCDALLGAFRDQFLENLGGTIGTLGLSTSLLKNIDLTNFTDEDKNWAQMVLTHDAGQDAWKLLPCREQLIYRRECNGIRGGIPMTAKVDHQPDKGHYTILTLEEVEHFTPQDLKDLHDYYESKNSPWMELPYHIQEALNERFVETGKQTLPTPWDVTYDYANSLTKDSFKAKSLLAFYVNNQPLWHALDEDTREKLVEMSSHHYLNVNFDAVRHQKAKQTYYFHQIPYRLKRKMHSIKNRAEPYMTKRHMTIAGTIGTAYVVTELAGIPNGVPDVIFNSLLGVTSWTLGTGWSMFKGTLSLAGTVVSYPFTSGGNGTATDASSV